LLRWRIVALCTRCEGREDPVAPGENRCGGPFDQSEPGELHVVVALPCRRCPRRARDRRLPRRSRRGCRAPAHGAVGHHLRCQAAVLRDAIGDWDGRRAARLHRAGGWRAGGTAVGRGQERLGPSDPGSGEGPGRQRVRGAGQQRAGHRHRRQGTGSHGATLPAVRRRLARQPAPRLHRGGRRSGGAGRQGPPGPRHHQVPLRRLPALTAGVGHDGPPPSGPLGRDAVLRSRRAQAAPGRLHLHPSQGRRGGLGSHQPSEGAPGPLEPRARRAASVGIPSGRTSYRTLPEHEEELKRLAQENPGLVRLVALPLTSWEGRQILGVEIAENVTSATDGRPAYVQVGTHHAREWPANEATLEWGLELVRATRRATRA
jgi:hypothetical protein